MILTIGFMALKSEKIDALSGAIPTLKEIIWRKKARHEKALPTRPIRLMSCALIICI